MKITDVRLNDATFFTKEDFDYEWDNHKDSYESYGMMVVEMCLRHPATMLHADIMKYAIYDKVAEMLDPGFDPSVTTRNNDGLTYLEYTDLLHSLENDADILLQCCNVANNLESELSSLLSNERDRLQDIAVHTPHLLHVSKRDLTIDTIDLEQDDEYDDFDYYDYQS